MWVFFNKGKYLWWLRFSSCITIYDKVFILAKLTQDELQLTIIRLMFSIPYIYFDYAYSCLLSYGDLFRFIQEVICRLINIFCHVVA